MIQALIQIRIDVTPALKRVFRNDTELIIVGIHHNICGVQSCASSSILASELLRTEMLNLPVKLYKWVLRRYHFVDSNDELFANNKYVLIAKLIPLVLNLFSETHLLRLQTLQILPLMKHD